MISNLEISFSTKDIERLDSFIKEINCILNKDLSDRIIKLSGKKFNQILLKILDSTLEMALNGEIPPDPAILNITSIAMNTKINR